MYIMGISEHFGTENYGGRHDIVQNLCEFQQFCLYDILDPKCFVDFKNVLLCYSYTILWSFVLEIGAAQSTACSYTEPVPAANVP